MKVILATEIDYAIREKREKGDRFAYYHACSVRNASRCSRVATAIYMENTEGLT